MIKTDHIESRRKPGEDYFILMCIRKNNTPLSFYLSKFDPEDYWIYKSTNKFREVSIDEFLSFKNASYIFFNKDIYDKNHIDKWVEFVTKLNCFWFLHKPFPPYNPENLIEIR